MGYKIVIIGSGFAGLQSALAARSLITQNVQSKDNEGAHIKVIVISPEPRLELRPRLYEANPQNMFSPLEKLFSETGIQYTQGYVTTVNTQEHQIHFQSSKDLASTISYDRLVLAAGSHLNLPNIPGLKEHAFSIDQLDDAKKLDGHLHRLVGQPDTKARNSVIICGGGFTGIEIAAELRGRLRRILGAPTDVHLTIVEREAEIGPELGAGPRPVILKALKELNISIKVGDAVSEIDSNGIVTSSGERLEANTVIWTGGMVATVLTSQIPGKKDRFGRIVVDRDLRVPTAQDVFVTGDAACAVADEDGHMALMSCQHALVLGRYSGYNAAADLLNLPLKQYSQEKYGTCLALGTFGAVVTEGWDRKVTAAGAKAGLTKQFINGVIISPPLSVREAFEVSHPEFELPRLDDGGFTAFLQSNHRLVLLRYIWRFLLLKLGAGFA